MMDTILQALIITAVTAIISVGITNYVNTKIINVQFEDLKKEFKEYMVNMKDEWKEIRRRLHEVEGKVATHEQIIKLPEWIKNHD